MSWKSTARIEPVFGAFGPSVPLFSQTYESLTGIYTPRTAEKARPHKDPNYNKRVWTDVDVNVKIST